MFDLKKDKETGYSMRAKPQPPSISLIRPRSELTWEASGEDLARKNEG